VYIKTSRSNRDGGKVRYLQLAHNEWDPVAQTARTKVLYNFGRAEELDRAAIQRLIGALSRLLGRDTTAGGPVAGMPAWSSASPGRWAGRGCWTGCGTPSVSTPP
jgi:hypothetical protein